MTLATSIHIQAPLDYQIVFLKAREIIGIPAEHPFKVSDDNIVWKNGECVWSVPGGFDSALDVTHAHGEKLEHVMNDPENEECYADDPFAFIEVGLDTTYSYNGPNGETCAQLHRRITAELGAWLDEQGANWWAYDEFTGEWHERTPCPVTD